MLVLHVHFLVVQMLDVDDGAFEVRHDLSISLDVNTAHFLSGKTFLVSTGSEVWRRILCFFG